MRNLLLLMLAVMALCLVGCGGTLGGTATGVLTGTPVILAVTPNPAVRGSTITITGTNLNGTNTTAYFSGLTSVSSTASSGGSSSIVVTVPSGIPAGTYTLYLITTDGQGNYSSQSNSVTIQLS